jgi:CheY-like chemotaxis protein
MKNLEILVVDDLKENRETAKQYFESIGLKVDLAIDYESGKEKMKQKDYFAAILDLQLPNKVNNFGDYGFELEEIAKVYSIPAVVLTGRKEDNHHGLGSSILIDKKMQGSTSIKTDIKSWEKAYEALEKFYKPEVIWKSKKQYTNVTGIRFKFDNKID